METQDPQDQDLRYQHYQQLLQHNQQLLQYNQQLLQYNQHHYQRLLQFNLQQIQELLQGNQWRLEHNQQLWQTNQIVLQHFLRSNQQLLQSSQQLLQSNQQRMQHFGQPDSMPFHQVPYSVYSQGLNVCYGPGPMHGNARPIMAIALGTSNAGESYTSWEENRSISDDQKVDYERRQNYEALMKSMVARYLRVQTAKLNRLSLPFQERELEQKSRTQEILQERQNNLQNPASDSNQDRVTNSIGQEGSA